MEDYSLAQARHQACSLPALHIQQHILIMIKFNCLNTYTSEYTKAQGHIKLVLVIIIVHMHSFSNGLQADGSTA